MKIHSFLTTITLVLMVLFWTSPSYAEVLFPEETGSSLLEQIEDNYQPKKHLGYDKSRDVLYAEIDNHDGKVSGIYTNFTLNFDPDSPLDPSKTLYQNSKGINAEHIWPQSFGASGTAKDDQHILFPSRVKVNSDRNNKPFGEIPDQQTKRWYFKADRRETLPDEDIDQYSESVKNLFEPREDRKGNVARAMFYFKAIYPKSADQAFFNQQKDILCLWNQQDPVDQREAERNQAIASNTQGNENPFIVDDTLASRTFCLE